MNGLITTVTPYIDHYGYLAVFGVILLEDFGMPVPGETLLIAGALLASQGKMDIVTLLCTACIAAITGDNIGYAIGRFGGRGLVFRYGRYVLITEGRLRKAERFFCRYGGVVVVMARFLAVLRQLNGIVAGTVKMSWRQFLLYNILGAALWVTFWGMLFYEVGERALRFEGDLKDLQSLLLGLLLATTGALAIYLLHHRKG